MDKRWSISRRLHALRGRIEALIWSPSLEASRRKRAIVQRWVQILIRSVEGFFETRAFSTASALTYTTLLTLVPLLAIVLPILKTAGVYENAYAALLRLIDTQLPPGMTPAEDEFRQNILTFVTQIRDFLTNTSLKNLGIYGMGGLLLAALSLLSNIEQAMNDAWAVHRARHLGRKLVHYLAMLFVFTLMVTALSMTATAGFVKFTQRWDEFGLSYVQAYVLQAVPLLIAWPAFTILYRFMPNTRVRWNSAVMAGLLAALIFQGMQSLFFRFHLLLDRYNKIYGAFAYVVIIFVMIYFTWCIMLWGVHVASAHQNLRDLRRRRRPWHNTPAERETLALRMAAILAFQKTEPTPAVLDIGELADLIKTPPGPVREILDLFQQHDLVQTDKDECGYQLICPLDEISVLDLLRLVRQGHWTPVELEETAGGILGRLGEDLTQPLRTLTLRALAALPLEQIQTFRL